MTLSLPDPVSTYFEVSNGSDIARLTRCFAPDAVVVDEGRTYRGHDAIQSWQREAQKKFQYTVEPVSISRDGYRLTVTAQVAGNFPGSPARLDHVFVLAGDRIASLEIG
ncbi:nuclear transport factor 2 family protein [Thauera butanivorans]|uniref:nuclear transport factor 2 family protein n=1 Tax=Thauera butanivorans TaxID=86174 RepID=UPI003AB1B258